MGSPIRRWVLCGSCMAILLLSSVSLSAQTFSEWFRQKNTQKKYLLKQIAALHVYADFLKKGYKIAGDGLSLVKGFSGGEFDLHRIYLASLKAVNPVVSKNPKVADMIDACINIRLLFAGLGKLELKEEHRSYIASVRKNLMEKCEQDLAQLESLVTAGKLEMKDDERLQRLEELYQDIADKLAFARHFNEEVKKMAMAEKTEKQSIQQLKNYHGTD